jgi:hypothetical protein
MKGRLRPQPDIASLKRKIIGDSLERKRDLDQLIRMVRKEEQEKSDAVRALLRIGEQ